MSLLVAPPSSALPLQAQPAEERAVSVLLRSFAPFPSTLSLALPARTTIGDIVSSVSAALGLDESTSSLLRTSTQDGKLLSSTVLLYELEDGARGPVFLELGVRMLGGKGGFGSMLRAQGGKMSSQKTSNNDSCRDLNGRRLSTMKEAKKLAAYLEAAPAREAALSKQQQEKYAKLERMLGRQPKSRSDFEEAANKLDEAGEELEGEGSASPDADRGEGGSGSKGEGSAKFVPVRGKEASSSGVKPVAGGKHRFDDTEYLEQSREIVDNVRSAVASAMMRKRKKAGKATTTATTKAASSGATKSVAA